MTHSNLNPKPISFCPYRERGVAEIRASFGRGARRVLFVLPTGGGETTVFSYITSAAAARGNRVAVLVHRQELVDQVSGALSAMGVPHGIVAGGYPETPEPVQVASVASLVRRLGRSVWTARRGGDSVGACTQSPYCSPASPSRPRPSQAVAVRSAT